MTTGSIDRVISTIEAEVRFNVTKVFYGGFLELNVLYCIVLYLAWCTQGLTTQALERCLCMLRESKRRNLLDLLDHAAMIFGGNDSEGSSRVHPTHDVESACAGALSRLGRYYGAGAGAGAGTDQLRNVIHLASQLDSVSRELEVTNREVEEASLLGRFESRLARCDAQLALGSLTEATRLLATCSTRFSKAIDDEKLSQGSRNTVQCALQSRNDAIRSRVFSTILDCLQKNESSKTMALLNDALAAASTLGLIHEAFDAVGQSILHNRILPILDSTAQRRDIQDDLSDEKSIYKCLKLMCSLFSPFLQGDMLAQAAQQFWQRVSGAYVKAKLVDTKPVEGGDFFRTLQFYTRSGAIAIKLEQKAEKLGLLPIELHGRGPVAVAVSAFIQDAENAVRGQFLASARDALFSIPKSQSLSSETVCITPPLPETETEAEMDELQKPASESWTELEGILSLDQAVGRYFVSRNAAQLVDLMQETLQANPSPTMVRAIAESASCLAVAFLSSRPFSISNSGSKPTTIDLTDAAIRYNDCMHIFRVLTRLGTRFPSVLAAALTTEQAGGTSWQMALTMEKDGLMEEYVNLLLPSNTSGLAYDGPAIIRQKKLVRQLLSRISDRLPPLWQVLDRNAAIHGVGFIVNSLAGALVTDLLGMEGFSEELAAQIPNEILGDIVMVEDGSEDGSEDRIPALVCRATGNASDAKALLRECGNVERLISLCHLLALPSSRDIAVEFSSRSIRSTNEKLPRINGLTPDEVVHMITALYEDSQYRSQSIDMVMASSGAV
jgi:hypothetical protein